MPDRVREQLGERSCQEVGSTRLDEHAGLPVDNQLGNAADSSGHDRNTGRHRLDDRKGTTFVVAGEHEDRRAREKFRHVGAGPEQRNGAAETFGRDVCVELGSQRPISDEIDTRFVTSVPHLCERLHDEVRPLRRCEPAHEDDSARLRPGRSDEAREVDSVGDHTELGLAPDSRVEPGRAFRLRDGHDGSAPVSRDALEAEVQARLRSRCGPIRPSVRREDRPTRAAGEDGGAPREKARLCGVRMNDVCPSREAHERGSSPKSRVSGRPCRPRRGWRVTFASAWSSRQGSECACTQRRSPMSPGRGRKRVRSRDGPHLHRADRPSRGASGGPMNYSQRAILRACW